MVLHFVATPRVGFAFEVVTTHSVVDVEVQLQAVGQLPSVQQTDRTGELPSVVCAVTNATYTSIRNQVPNAIGVVTSDHVANVQQHLLLQVEVFDTIAVALTHETILVRSLDAEALDACILAILTENTLTPEARQLCTHTDAGSEPLTKCNGETVAATEMLERTLRVVCRLLLVRVESGVSSIRLNEPVVPERICSHAVLQCRSFLLLSH